MNFSVCMSVYRNDKAEHFKIALDSIINQTVPPTEIVLVIDGPVGEDIRNVIEQGKSVFPNFKVVQFEENKGLGNALRASVENASYPLIVRMDADDISVPDRFEKQLTCFINDPDLSVVGGDISEFIEDQKNVVGIRRCPETNEKIKTYIKYRDPLNHVSVMMKKEAVQKSGGYLDWYLNEDYYLWIRMYEKNCKFKNLPETLVYVRVGKDMYQRRGSWKYFRSEQLLQKYMLRKKIISLPIYLFNVFVRFVVQVLMPNWLRGIVFQKLFRKAYK